MYNIITQDSLTGKLTGKGISEMVPKAAQIPSSFSFDNWCTPYQP